MSLDWDLSGIKNYKELCWGPATDEEGYKLLNGVTDGLIWKTMSVGMGRITEKNYEEFFMRLCMIDVATEGGEGPLNTWVTDEDGKKTRGKRHYTLKEVYDHIGLSTNVSSMTRNQFKAKIWRFVEGEAKSLRNADKSMEVKDA